MPTQLEACRRYASECGYLIVGEYTDEYTGTALDRPGMTALLLDAARQRPDVIVVYDIDRLGREVVVQAIAEQELSRHGARIEYVLGGYDATPEGELLKLVKGAIAQYENRQRVERSRRGKIGRVRAGYPIVPTGRAPFGYRYVSERHKGQLVVNEEEAAVVRLMYHWLVVERVSSYEIAKRLWERGILTRGDLSHVVVKKTGRGEWSPGQVRRILTNPLYKGEWSWGKTRRQRVNGRTVQRRMPEDQWVTIAGTAIVDAELWEQAQECLRINREMAARNTRRQYLLRGLVFCECGRRCVGRYKKEPNFAYYRCPVTDREYWRSDCPVRYHLRQDWLEATVWNYVLSRLQDPDLLMAEVQRQREAQREQAERRAERLRAVEAALADVDRKLGALLEQALEGFPKAVIEEKKHRLLEQRRDLEAEQQRLLLEREEHDITPSLGEGLRELAEAVRQAAPVMTFAEKRRILELLRVRVDVVDREHVRVSGIIGEQVVALACSWAP